VLEGHGHSLLGTDLDNVHEHTWSKGDLIVVDHFLWHQHFNDDGQHTAKLVRMHMFDSLLETMRALCYPLVLFEEGPEAVPDQGYPAESANAGPSRVSRPTWP
jgi:gentisate 1,2-dioxygenase